MDKVNTVQHTEKTDMTAAPHGDGLVMRSKADDLTVWQSVRRYKTVGYIAMLAAFCASLDGYRKSIK